MDKKHIGRVFLCSILVLFIGIFVIGKNGLTALLAIKRINNTLAMQNEALKSHIAILEYRIAQWSHEPFFKEQYAREKLQLAYPDDHIYYVL